MNLASNNDDDQGVIIYDDLFGIYKVLLLLNKHKVPSFLLQNLSSYNVNNQMGVFMWRH